MKKINIRKILLYTFIISIILFILYLIYLIYSNIVEKYVNSPEVFNKSIGIKLYLFYKWHKGLSLEANKKLGVYKRIYGNVINEIIKYNKNNNDTNDKI